MGGVTNQVALDALASIGSIFSSVLIRVHLWRILEVPCTP